MDYIVPSVYLGIDFDCLKASYGFEYRPIRVENRDDLEEFIENSVLSSCRNRDIIVDYIRHEKFSRPRHNIVRNSGDINSSDSNLLFYTVI